jgi:acetyltransferase-like isoleucine patch superfamily enzyme
MISYFRTRVARGEGSFWKALKSLAKMILAVHLPVNRVTRPVFGGLYASHVSARELILWLQRFFWCEPLFRSQCVSVGSHFQMEQLPYLTGSGAIVIGNHVQLSGKSCFTFSNRHTRRPELSIGDHSFVGHQCSFRVARSLKIGRHCLIAGGVLIADYDGHPLDPLKRRMNETIALSDIRAVEIGDDVWIGAGATILKGVTIGSRSIIGAHAVVTRDVPADTIVAGNPAVVVKTVPRAEGAAFESDTGVDLSTSLLKHSESLVVGELR